MASKLFQNRGERLLPSLVDDIALSDPGRILYSVPKTENITDGFHDINAKDFSKAVNRCSWYLERTLGKGKDFPTLTYLGPQDVVYAIIVVACIKTGYKALLSSARNPLPTHLSMLEKTDCNTLLLHQGFAPPIISHILDSRPTMRVVDIQPMEHWLTDGPDEPYPYLKTFENAKFDPFVVLHTSGSTGIAKPIVQTHATVAALDAFTQLPMLGLEDTYPAMCAGSRVYLAFPLFHCSGISMLLPASIYAGFTVVLGLFPPSADVVDAVHLHGNVQHSCLPPTVLVDLVKDPAKLQSLAGLKQITFGGGPLPQAVGDIISSKTRLLNCLGSTECGVLPVQLCDSEDWTYMRVSPLFGHEYRPVFDGFYEQVVVRNPQYQQYQGIFGTFPGLNEWPMKDLYTKHPSKDGVWLYKGRTDDIVILSTGDKISPVEMESVIEEEAAVSAAVVTGFGRFKCALLLEAVQPPANELEKNRLLNKIWSTIEKANQRAPSSAQISRHMVAFTSREKPMLRAGKGTVQRKLTVDLYSKELDMLYKTD
ncbi:hypothetical protein BGZ63DRAFT_354238 [Mariannaea sp. PMI_226]|nr:hypothetical protein BGZ63DRAFT_354238 [Mariannaea sp. PMI_226]